MKRLFSSRVALIFGILFMTIVFFGYYPKWNNLHTEATISWDISGYYLYLPAIFIYDDLDQLSFMDEIIPKYYPTPDFQQATKHWNGNYIMKYSCGLAIQYLPFFTIGHIYAKNSKYSADGFSKPYQFMISLGSLLMAFLGLFFLRKVLLFYFKDKVVAIGILTLIFATNYFDYSTITGAHSHSWLFSLYAILVYYTIKFYKRPSYILSIIIGLVLGLIALTRPTDIVLFVIPVFWGLKNLNINSIKSRIDFMRIHLSKYLLAGTLTVCVGFIQLFYWKLIGNEWIIFSYKGESFDFLRPHLIEGWFSYKSGWLVYTPIMILSVLGFWHLYKRKEGTFIPIILFFILFNYIVFSWWNWWYGGSLGQRTMVQIYPLLLFPICSFIENYLQKNKLLFNSIFIGSLIVCIYYNLWLTHQAHRGGLLMPGHMTKPYFWASLGRYNVDEDVYKLLDTDEIFKGEKKQAATIYFNDFENLSDTTVCELKVIEGSKSLCLNENQKASPIFKVKIEEYRQWSRATATFRVKSKEWTMWQMTQFLVLFYKGDELIDYKMIRLQRLLNDNSKKEIYLDAKVPNGADSIGVQINNSYSKKPIIIDNVKLELFDE